MKRDLLTDPEVFVADVRRRYPREPGLTDWISGNVAPHRTGWYQRAYCDGVCVHWFDAGAGIWRHPSGPAHWRQVGAYPCWRGLAEDAQLVMIEQWRNGKCFYLMDPGKVETRHGEARVSISYANTLAGAKRFTPAERERLVADCPWIELGKVTWRLVRAAS